jgi:PBP1b-binding outer membrane lipoprotein LpoB
MLKNKLLYISVFMIALLISGCTNASDPQKNYISEETAINIAKKQDFNAPKEVTWSAKFEKNAPIEMNNEVKPYDVWKVTATYPAGNKMIVTLDAKTGDILALGEIESGR